MYGRRLATTEAIIALRGPDCAEEFAVLESWAADNDLPVHAVDIGDTITDVYDPDTSYLGVTLGGDGTFLEGVRAFSPKEIPILGVKAGSMAFLAAVAPEHLPDALDEVVAGGAAIDERQQLHVAADVDETGINDVTIEHDQPDNPVERKVSRLQVFADGEFVGEFEGSGIAVATPTGSTGISLSAGGPIHLPSNNTTLQIVPLHTHRLGVRPLVVSADTTITVVSDSPANLLVDGGRAHTQLDPDEVATISGADTCALVVTTSYDDDFFTAIADQLGWSAHAADIDRIKTDLVGGDNTAATDTDLLERARDTAADAARAAGEALRELHGQTESVEFKTDPADIVTEADHRADDIIRSLLESAFPDHGIRSEESERKPTNGEYTWLIDPLDGTGNFAHGNPNYAISIALLADDRPVMGVVYEPETEELFTAIEGRGATVNGMPISTTDRDTLAECMLISGYDPDGQFLAHLYQDTRGIRSIGSAALNLCYVAAGSADATWEYDTYPWDVAAGVVIAREAGATITNTAGDPFAVITDTGGRNELVASNGPVHETLLDHLAGKQDLQRDHAGDDAA
jgi:myo-inositol-1(or 4)-monophosphatase